jgi:hypothetical protein
MSRFPLLLPALALALVWSATSCNLYRRVTGRKAAAADSSLVITRDTTRLSTDSSVVKVDSPATPAGGALLQQLLPLWTATTAWNTFDGKAKVHYEGKGESHDFTANIRMEKGKSIWVSVTALGFFEAARVLIRPDTIIILDRVNKEARILPYGEASSLIPVQADFASLQNLIIGDALQTGHQPNLAWDTLGTLVLTYSSPDFTQSLQFARTDTLLRFQGIASQTTSVISQYKDWNVTGGRRFANNRILVMSDKGDTHNITLDFSKATFDEAIDMPFTIPDKYSRK